jgi:hypothetical protein
MRNVLGERTITERIGDIYFGEVYNPFSLEGKTIKGIIIIGNPDNTKVILEHTIAGRLLKVFLNNKVCYP